MVELHGNITRTKCFDEDRLVESWPHTADIPPRCPRRGGPLRLDVVWFGEPLSQDAWRAAVAAVAGCDVFLAVGTSVWPAADLPIQARRARRRIG